MIIMIINTELTPVILTPSNRCAARILRVTMAMDNPMDTAMRSKTFNRLKKTSVQANPGRKNISMNPITALTVGTRSRKGRINPNIWLKSTFYAPSQSVCIIATNGQK